MNVNYLRRLAEFKFQRWRRTVNSVADISKNVEILLVTVGHELAQTQIYPFYFYQQQLKNQHNLNFVEWPLDEFVKAASCEAQRPASNENIKRIYFQPYLHMDAIRQQDVLHKLTQFFPCAKIALMDWFAPLHIRPALSAAEYIDVYLKKQTYRDFEQYRKPTLGDTNLSDYFCRRHNISQPVLQYDPPPGFEEKIVLAPNFGISP